MSKARFAILSMMKDEGPRVLEWLAYHRLIGFDQVVIYSNDCRDGTDAMLDRLDAMGLCRHLRNVVPAGRKPQPNALTLAQKNPEVLAADWLMVLDADEFLHVKTGDGSVGALVAACPEASTGVAVNWRVMGSAGLETWSADGILDQFTTGADTGFRRGWGVKTLFQPFMDLKLGIHRPSLKGARRDPDTMARQRAMAWVNGSGVPLPPSFLQDSWRTSAATVGYALAEVAHFAVQSREAYLLRGDRGNVNLKPAKYDAMYFAVFDRNDVALPSLSGWSDRIAAQVADWVQDNELANLHRASIAWHRSRLTALRAAPEWPDAMEALRDAAGTPLDRLDDMFLSQPFPPKGKKMIADMLASGRSHDQVTRMVREAVARSEAALDAREAAELRKMGIEPAFEGTARH